MIKYEIFAWGSTVDRLEKGRNVLCDQVQDFANKIGQSKIIAINSMFNAIIVWYID